MDPLTKRRFMAAGLIFAGAAAALAEDERILGRDDVDFATALKDNGFADLAKRVLEVIAKKGSDPNAKPAIDALGLDIAQEDARKIEDPVKRKDALVDV